MKKENLKDLEKYAYWIKVNDILAGPSFIVSSVIIIIYVIATILFLAGSVSIQHYLIYYYILENFFS